MVQYPMDEKHPAKEETSVKTGTRPRIGIIRQVAVFFALSVILTGIFYHLTQRRLTDTAIRKQTESLAGRISAEVKMAVMEYPAYQWMIGYWHNHYAEMDIEYDDIYAPGTVTWQKYARLRDHQPDLILKYARAETFSALPEEDKKLSAEIIYSWLVTRLNQIMQAHKPAYLYCAMTGEPYDSLFFLFSIILSRRLIRTFGQIVCLLFLLNIILCRFFIIDITDSFEKHQRKNVLFISTCIDIGAEHDSRLPKVRPV